MKRNKIVAYLEQLNEELKKMNVKGDICLYGGAVMCIAYNARPATKDVDAIFEPTSKIREAARIIAERNQLSPNWLNDSVKGFVEQHDQKILFNWSNLQVYVPPPEFMLAMKALSSRAESMDKTDIKFLINRLGLTHPDEVFQIVEKFYPNNLIKPATQFFIEELFDK